MSLLDTLPLEIENIILSLKRDMDEVELNFKHYYMGRFNRVLRQLKQVHHCCANCNKCWELDELYYCDECDKNYCDTCYFNRWEHDCDIDMYSSDDTSDEIVSAYSDSDSE